MKRLGRRPMNDAAEIAAVVAECLQHLESGLRLLARAAPAGEVTVDLVALDAHGRFALIVCDVVAGPGTVMRAVESAAWWHEHQPLLARVFPDAVGEREAPPRTVVVASRFDDRARRLLRALGAVAPAAVECTVFDDGGEARVSLERLSVGRPGAPAEATAAGPAAGGEAGAAPEQGRRATELIQQLERLRVSRVFR